MPKRKKRLLSKKELLSEKLMAFCRAGAAVTAADKERSTFWRNLEQAAANLSDEEAAFIAGETKELRSVKPVSPIGEGNTPLHVLIKILDGNI